VEGFDAVDKIGEATHQRFIINADKFNAKMAEKATKA
jgi:predicted thioesterase